MRMAKAGITIHEDASLWQVAEEGKSCEVQKQIIPTIKEGNKIKDLSKMLHSAFNFKDIWEEAGIESTVKGKIVVFNSRVYNPASFRSHFLKLLHASHMSADKMYKTVRDIWIWEGIKHHIQQLAQNCSIELF